MRVTIQNDPYFEKQEMTPWKVGFWPCAWIKAEDANGPPVIAAYRKQFSIEEAATARVHVSADERYELFLDGERIGRGSERGDERHWFYETYDLPLEVGEHVIVARVWSLGRFAPLAQMSIRHGFIFAPQEETFIDLLGTGTSEWDAKILGGYECEMQGLTFGNPGYFKIDAASFDWGFERGEGGSWRPAVTLNPGANGLRDYVYSGHHMMVPAVLPPMMEETRHVGRARHVAEAESDETTPVPVREADHIPDEGAAWDAMLAGEGAVTVPANAARRVIVDLDDYYCAYPEITTSKGAGASVRVHWAESLYKNIDHPWIGANPKGNRDQIEGKFFGGVGDTFLPDGGAGRVFDTLWWRAGRYLEILVQTAGEPLTINAFTLRETGYPFKIEGKFKASDERLANFMPIGIRALRMCAHETYMDCPYYEQLMYVGDTRLEVLTTYALTRDDRLPRKAITLYDVSRLTSGITQSRYPCNDAQIIPPFSLWWIGMLHDYALWRGDREFVRARMRGVRAVLDAMLSFQNAEGFIEGPDGWNYTDWVPEWRHGVPPDGFFGVSGVINWQMVWILKQAAELEDFAGDPELAARDRRIAGELAARLKKAFWVEERNMFADDLGKAHFSEHAQCLAILSGELDPVMQVRTGEALLAAGVLSRATIYFSYYLLETYRVLGRMDKFFEKMAEKWFGLRARGFKTTPEQPEPTRSDCHAWGAHPIFHYFASVAGIRPDGFGFERARIAPQLGPLESVEATFPHPAGDLAVDLKLAGGALTGSVTSPVPGTLTYNGRTWLIEAGQRTEL